MAIRLTPYLINNHSAGTGHCVHTTTWPTPSQWQNSHSSAALWKTRALWGQHASDWSDSNKIKTLIYMRKQGATINHWTGPIIRYRRQTYKYHGYHKVRSKPIEVMPTEDIRTWSSEEVEEPSFEITRSGARYIYRSSSCCCWDEALQKAWTLRPAQH